MKLEIADIRCACHPETCCCHECELLLDGARIAVGRRDNLNRLQLILDNWSHLYNATNEVLAAEMIDMREPLAHRLMSALKRIDGGLYTPMQTHNAALSGPHDTV